MKISLPEAPPPKALRQRLERLPRLLALPVLLLGVWWLVKARGLTPEYMLPSPRAVWETLRLYTGFGGGQDATTGRLAGDLATSLRRVACGCLLAVPPGPPMCWLPWCTASGPCPASVGGPWRCCG